MAARQPKSIFSDLAELYNSSASLPQNKAIEALEQVADRALMDFVKSHDKRCLFIGAHACMVLGRLDAALELLEDELDAPDANEYTSRLMYMAHASSLYMLKRYAEAHRSLKPFEDQVENMSGIELIHYPYICLEQKDRSGFKRVVDVLRSREKENEKDREFLQELKYLNVLYCQIEQDANGAADILGEMMTEDEAHQFLAMEITNLDEVLGKSPNGAKMERQMGPVESEFFRLALEDFSDRKAKERAAKNVIPLDLFKRMGRQFAKDNAHLMSELAK